MASLDFPRISPRREVVLKLGEDDAPYVDRLVKGERFREIFAAFLIFHKYGSTVRIRFPDVYMLPHYHFRAVSTKIIV